MDAYNNHNQTESAVAPSTSITFRLATADDEPQLTGLLMQSYQASTEFSITDPGYYGRHFTSNRTVVVAAVNSRIVAMMSADLIRTHDDFKDEHEGHLSANNLPAIGHLRAATSKNSRGLGLNSMMRLYILEAASRMGLKSSICVVYEGSPRTALMRDIGYKIFTLKAEGDDHFRNLTPCCFALLDLQRDGEMAVQSLRHRLTSILNVSHWEGSQIDDVLGLGHNANFASAPLSNKP